MGIVGPVTRYPIVFHSNLHFLQEAKEGDAERIRIMKMVKVWYRNDFSRPHKKFFFFCITLKAVAIISYFFTKQRKLLTEVLTYFMTSNRKIQGSLNFTI